MFNVIIANAKYKKDTLQEAKDFLANEAQQKYDAKAQQFGKGSYPHWRIEDEDGKVILHSDDEEFLNEFFG